MFRSPLFRPARTKLGNIGFAGPVLLRAGAALPFACLAYLSGVPALASEDPALAVLAPHRAGYLITLTSAAPGRPIAAISGTLSIDVRRDCDGLSTRQTMRVALTPARGELVYYIGDYGAFERSDTGAYTFDISTRIGEVVTERYRGRADRSQFAAAATAEYQMPPSTHIDLPGEVYFPLHHIGAVLVAADAGERAFTGTVFAGSQPHGAPYTATTEIAGPFAVDQGSFDGLTGTPWWRLHTAYFAYRATSPSYEIVREIHDNGVARNFIFDYGGLVLEARLISVAPNPAPRCAVDGAPEIPPPGSAGPAP